MYRHTPGLVCDDNFNSVNAESACNTLGYSNGGTYSSISIADRWSEDEIPFLKDDVNCTSPATNFLSCPSNDWGDEDCNHSENVLLTCFATGKQSLTFSGSFGFHVAFTDLGLWTNSQIT